MPCVTANDLLGTNGGVSPAHDRTTQRRPSDVERVPSNWVVIPTIVGTEDDQIRDGSGCHLSWPSSLVSM